MARPRSPDKRDIILKAAGQLFADEGLNAPTVRIAKAAGVAEGSIFTYFASKDELINELYLELKGELRAAVVLPPDTTDLRECLWKAWHGYVSWGVAHPREHRLLTVLALSGRITEAAQAQALDAFGDVADVLRQAMALGALRQQSPGFVGALMSGMADTTVDFIRHCATDGDLTCRDGFSAFWNAISHG